MAFLYAVTKKKIKNEKYSFNNSYNAHSEHYYVSTGQ